VIIWLKYSRMQRCFTAWKQGLQRISPLVVLF